MPESLVTGRVEVVLDHGTAGFFVTLAGHIDERAELAAVADRVPPGPVLVDLDGVKFINSLGVQAWIGFLTALETRGCRVTLARCSLPMIEQINMIVEAKGSAEVASFYAPYACDACGFEAPVGIDVATHRARLENLEAPPMLCPQCGGGMQLSEYPERYFLFLTEG